MAHLSVLSTRSSALSGSQSKKGFEPTCPEGFGGGRRRGGNRRGRAWRRHGRRGGNKNRLIIAGPMPFQARVSFSPIVRRDICFELRQLSVGLFFLAQSQIGRGVGLCKLHCFDYAPPKIPRQENDDGGDDNRKELRETEVAFFAGRGHGRKTLRPIHLTALSRARQ